MGTGAVFGGLDYHDASVRGGVLDPHGPPRGNRDCPNDARAIVD